MPRPPPIRTDGSNAFAHYSMQERVPRIARDLLASNGTLTPGERDAVEQLARSIEDNAPVPAPRPPAPDVEAWAAAHADHTNDRWLDGEWFYAELAFYREIAQACRFWETGRDPFAPAKEEELSGARPWTRLEQAIAMRGSREERIAGLLDACLWGNRVDLSYTVAASRDVRHDDDLLVDEREAALPFLVRPGSHVHLVADNTGAELALDLALVDALLETPGSRVTLHLKMQPVFVSDATAHDVLGTFDRMAARGEGPRSLAKRLRDAFDAGRLVFAPDPFWSGPRFLWECPGARRALAGGRHHRHLQGRRELPARRRRRPLGRRCAVRRGRLVRLVPDAVLAHDEERLGPRPPARPCGTPRRDRSAMADRRPTRARADVRALTELANSSAAIPRAFDTQPLEKMSYIRAAANEGTLGDHGRDDARRASQVRAGRDPTAHRRGRAPVGLRRGPHHGHGARSRLGLPLLGDHRRRHRRRARAPRGGRRSTAGATCASTTRRGATSTARTRTTTSTSASTARDREYFVMIRRPASSMHVEIGIKTHEGYFQPIARSGRADFPRSGPSPDTHLEWMTVTSGEPPPCVAPYRSRYSGPEPPLPGREGAGYVDVWRAGYAPSTQRRAAAARAHARGPRRRRTRDVEHRGATSSAGGASTSGAPSGARACGSSGGSTTIRRASPSSSSARRRRTCTFEGGEMVVYGPWRLTIRGFEARAGAARAVDVVDALGPRVDADDRALGARRRAAGRLGLRARAASCAARPSSTRVLERGASELWRLGGSERMWMGASEWLAAGALGDALARRVRGARSSARAGGIGRERVARRERAHSARASEHAGRASGRLARAMGRPRPEEK